MNMLIVRKQVTILGAVIALLISIPVASLHGLPVSWPFFLVLGYVLTAIHWWLLANVITSLFSTERTLSVLWSMMAFFPLAMALALCIVAGKLDRLLMVPVSGGILSVPIAVTLYCIVSGVKGLLLHR